MVAVMVMVNVAVEMMVSASMIVVVVVAVVVVVVVPCAVVGIDSPLFESSCCGDGPGPPISIYMEDWL